MPPIYERPAKSLIADWAKANLTPDQTFSKSDVVRWFAEHYPKIKRSTIETHVEFMSVNCRSRLRYSAVKPGGGCDLFLKVGPNQYRLWNPDIDGPPLHKPNIEPPKTPEEIDENNDDAGSECAYERDLQNYLAKNLHSVEPGLRLYEEEEISGIQFSAGGRYIDTEDLKLAASRISNVRPIEDILAVDGQGSYDVIELQKMEPSKPVRGIIVAKEIMATFLKIFVVVLLVVSLAHAVIGWLRPDVMPGLSFLPGDIKYESPSTRAKSDP